MRIGLTWKIFGAMLAVALVPMAVLGYIVRTMIYSNLEDAAHRQLETQLRLAEAHVRAYVEQKLQVAKTVAALPGIVGMDGAVQRPILQAMAHVDPDFVSIRTLPPDGVTLVRSDDDPPTDYSDRAWFKQSMAGVDHTYQTVIARTTGKPSLTIGLPIRRGQQVVGVLSSQVELAIVSEMVEAIRFGETGFAWLVDTESKVMAHPDRELVTARADVADHPAVQQALAGSGVIDTYEQDGSRWLTGQVQLPQGWVLVVQMDETEALASARQFDQLFLTILVAAIAVVTVLGLALARYQVQPILLMARHANRMADGDLTGQLRLTRRDELGDMAEAMRKMQDKMREHVQEVQGAAAQVDHMVGTLDASGTRADESRQRVQQVFDDKLQEVEEATAQQQGRLKAVQDVVGNLVAAVDQVASSALHQAMEVERATAAVQDVMRQATAVSAGLERLASVTQSASTAVVTGQDTISSALEGIQLTQQGTEQAAATVRTLGERSQAIGTILEEIAAIADQTNLLALNAAIESARAGEAGRGFAVVAEEVRRLAERSARSAAEISDILGAIQAGVDETIAAMDEGARASAEGAKQAGQAQEVLTDMRKAVDITVTEATTIERTVVELNEHFETLAELMGTLAAVAEENSAAAEEMSASGESVRTTMQELDVLAQSSFDSVKGAGQELASIAAAVADVVDAAKSLQDVNENLKRSVTTLTA